MIRPVFDFLVSAKRALYSTDLFSSYTGSFPFETRSLKEILSDSDEKISFFPSNPAGKIKRKLPKTIEPVIHEKFYSLTEYSYSEKFVLKLATACVLFKECFVVTPKRNIIEEINPLMGRKHSAIHYKLALPKQTIVSKNSAVLINTNNYYHWLFETLPRLEMLKEKRIKFSKLITGYDKSFKKETLSKLGISSSRVIPISDSTNLFAENLIVPSMPINSGNPTQKVCSFLRKNLLSKPSSFQKKKYKKIYVMRGNAKSRKVTNEGEVIDFLSKKGFTPVRMDGLSVKEQSQIFNSSEIIVSLHGAALANLVFCNKGTKVIELFHPDYVNVCYWALSNCMNLDYAYFFGEKKGLMNSELNVKIDLNKLDLTICLERI